jgi:hypothetical protein
MAVVQTRRGISNLFEALVSARLSAVALLGIFAYCKTLPVGSGGLLCKAAIDRSVALALRLPERPYAVTPTRHSRAWFFFSSLT